MYSDELKINEKYREYVLKTIDSTYNVLEGSVRSSKTVFNTLAFCMNLEDSDDMLHLAAAVDVSTAKAILGEGNGFGIKYYFAERAKYALYKDKPAMQIRTPKGIRWVIFCGAAKANSFQAIRGLSIGSIIATEVNLFDESFVQEMIRRTLNAKNRKFFFDLNPSIPTHWIYKDYLDRFEGNPDIVKYNYMHCTLKDNPSLSQSRIDEIIREYDPDSVEYRFAILGERVSPSGLAFRVYDRDIIKSIRERYLRVYVVADTGETKSATGMIAAGLWFDPDSRKYYLDIIDEYYWLNSEHKGHEKMFPDTASDIADFVRSTQNKTGRYPDSILIDESPELYRNVLQAFRSAGMPYSMIRYPKKDDDQERVKRIEGMLYKGSLRICDWCEHTLTALRNASFDQDYMEKHGRIKLNSDYDSEGHGDLLDCVSYITGWAIGSMS